MSSQSERDLDEQDPRGRVTPLWSWVISRKQPCLQTARRLLSSLIPSLRHITIGTHKNPPKTQFLGQDQEDEEASGVANGYPPRFPEPIEVDTEASRQVIPGQPGLFLERLKPMGKALRRA